MFKVKCGNEIRYCGSQFTVNRNVKALQEKFKVSVEVHEEVQSTVNATRPANMKDYKLLKTVEFKP